MDRRKIHKQLAKKQELEQQLIKPKESFQGVYELNVKPSTSKSGTNGSGNDFIFEKPHKFSISATNLKIKKAHATTLSDFFSQQRDQKLGLKKPLQLPTPSTQNRLVRTRSNNQQRIKLKNNNNDLANQNPMYFYHRNSNAIVQHILKMSESQVLYSMSRNNLQSSHNQSQSNNLDESPDLSSNNIKPSTSQYPNSSLRNTNQLNPLRNLTALTQTKPAVHFFEQKYQQEQEPKANLNNIKQDLSITNNIKQIQSNQGDSFKFSRDKNSAATQERFYDPISRSSNSSRFQRTNTSKLLDKKRDEIQNPKKFYCLSSVGFKNYKYPRPIEMPYEKESEKLTRMPLYLLPQSAPSKQIEDICINKYQTEVQELEQSIVEKQQSIQQNTQNSQTDIGQESIKVKSGEVYHLQSLENMKSKYQDEIEYLQNKASSFSKKRKYKTNAKYTFSDSKSKDIKEINMRSNRIVDISDKLFRNKNIIEQKMAITKANISRLQSDNSSFMQQGMSAQNKLQINQTIQQLYQELVQQSDQLKSNHRYTEEYRKRLEQEDEEGVEEDEYLRYDEEENFSSENAQYKKENDRNRKNKRSSDLLQLRESGGSAYIQEETEEEFQNENSSYKHTENQIQQQINSQEEYINKYIQNPNSLYNNNISDEFNYQIPIPQQSYDFLQNENVQLLYQEQEINQQQVQQKQEEEEEEDQIKIHSLADFKNTHPLTDRDIIQKPQLGQLMMNVLIDTFTVLKLNRLAIRNRILLSLGLNPQDVFQSVPKDVFKFFYEVLISKTATSEQNTKFIMKFFKLDDEDEEEEEQVLLELKDKQKIQEQQKQKMIIHKDEFKRILRILTISIDEKTKEGDKSLFDYMMENLILTEVIKPAEQWVDLEQFSNILLEGKINPKDIIDLICNLQ